MNVITLHPKLNHFPIALIFLAVLFEILFIWKKEDFYRRASVWMVYLGIMAAIIAAASGLLASDTLGHNSLGHDMVHDHRNIMLTATGIWAIVAILLRFTKFQTGKGRLVVLPLLIVVASLMTYGASVGGEMVFEHGTGVRVEHTDGHQDGHSLENEHSHDDHEHHH
jgi:uncharacterized membrane protein